MKKIICFDVNGTLIDGKTWDVLTSGRKDIEKELEESFNQYFKNEIKIEEAWSRFVSILKRAGISSREYIYSCCENENSFKEGAKDILLYLIYDKDYKNFFNDIDQNRISFHEITYDEEFIKKEYLPKLKYLSECLIKGKISNDEEFETKKIIVE